MVLSFVTPQAVRPVRIIKRLKHLITANELIHEHNRVLEVHVIICQTVNEQNNYLPAYQHVLAESKHHNPHR